MPSRPKHSAAQPLRVALDVGSPRAAQVTGTCISSSPAHVTRSSHPWNRPSLLARPMPVRVRISHKRERVDRAVTVPAVRGPDRPMIGHPSRQSPLLVPGTKKDAARVRVPTSPSLYELTCRAVSNGPVLLPRGFCQWCVTYRLSGTLRLDRLRKLDMVQHCKWKAYGADGLGGKGCTRMRRSFTCPFGGALSESLVSWHSSYWEGCSVPPISFESS